MQNAVLVFGTRNPMNREMIQQMASKDYSLITWSKPKLRGTYLHPTVITNEKGDNFVNCLFYESNNNGTLITDFYTKKMLNSTKKVKLVFLVPMETLTQDNVSFTHFMEWIATILPNTDKFEGGMVLLVTEQDVEVSPTLDTTLNLLSKTIQKLDGSVRPELKAKVNKLAKEFFSGKVGVLWEPVAALGTVDAIPFTNVLPTDVNLVSDKFITTADDLISAITEAEIVVFKNAVNHVDNMIGFINEESFSDHLQSLRRLKRVLENTKKEMVNATTWNGAADILDKNLEVVKISVDPSFKKNVSIGQDLLFYIQMTTGKKGNDFKDSISQIAFHPLISKIFHYITRYEDILGVYNELVADGESRPSQMDNFGNLYHLLSKKNLTLDSVLNNPKNYRDASVRAEEPQINPFYPQKLIEGTSIREDTPYKIHLADYEHCFLSVIPLEGKCGDRKFDKAPQILCSVDDKNEFYEKPGSSWFLLDCFGSRCLVSLEKGENGFLHVHYYECDKKLTGYFMFDEGGASEKRLGGVVPTKDSNIIKFHTNDGDHLTFYKWTGKARAGFWRRKGDPGLRFKFTPDIKLEARLFNFQFDPPSPFTPSKKDFAERFEMVNNGPTTLSRTITLKEEVSNEFSFGFSQDLSFCYKLTTEAKAEVTGVASVTTTQEFSAELKLGSHQDWKETKTKTFEISYNVMMPPYTTAKISAWYEKIENVKWDYTVQMEINGTAKQITRYNDVIEGGKASGWAIRDFLYQRGLGENVIKINDFSVVVEIKGVMTASIGLEGNIGVDSKDVSRS